MRTTIFICLLLAMSAEIHGQAITKEQLIFYTSEWQGERFEDGRPRIPDAIVARAANISIEEAWGFLRNQGFHDQFEGNWMMIHDDLTIAGRVLTALYMPKRPDLMKRMIDKGHSEGRIGAMNSWPIDMLSEGDVYVADAFGKIINGTLIGDNLGNAIYAKSKNGVIFNGSLRDLAGLEEIEGFNAFVRGWDPSYLTNVMLMGVNTPIRIGRAHVMPGDLVVAQREGVIFIPAHLAEETVINAEFVALKDRFGHQQLREGTYTPGQIDGRWSDEIKEAFLKWLDDNPDLIPMSRQELDQFMKDRTW